MWKGKVVQTGACNQAPTFQANKFKFNDNSNPSMGMQSCVTSKTFWVTKPSKIAGFTDVNKAADRQKKKNKIDLYRNLFRFKESSDEDWPSFENTQLGFG